MKENLEKIFADAARMPEGLCPLPEPGRGAPAIEEPELMDILPMEGESPDEWANKEEQSRFEQTINKLLKLGEITEAEAQKLLKDIED